MNAHSMKEWQNCSIDETIVHIIVKKIVYDMSKCGGLYNLLFEYISSSYYPSGGGGLSSNKYNATI